ncbi:hypothetical protein ACTXG5_18085 [Mycobacterium sp. Dal123C01]|uniref:hypothetical protein n=1 Tax=Mycobacterium sp. Dal123C01 TaxID=3457577 RepID=UPI00403EF121
MVLSVVPEALEVFAAANAAAAEAISTAGSADSAAMLDAAAGNPSTLASANQTKMNLELDISGVDGIQQSINQYLSYLDQFSTTVKAACTRLIQSG